METTKLSTKGQVIVPKAIRDANRWKPGTEFVVEEVRDGLVLRRRRPFPATSLDAVVGCLRYTGKPKTIAEMDRAVAAEVKARRARGRY